MSMKGGGAFELSPGQISSASEISMCIIWAIIEANKDKDENEEKELNTDLIAKWYNFWLESEPFGGSSSVFTAVGILKDTLQAKPARQIAMQNDLS